jgi:SAM-dependent methyltransferase
LVTAADRNVSTVAFDVEADSYDRFMGRYSARLAPAFADFARVGPGQVVLDVGCGPGALTGEVVRRAGPAAVVAVDPSASFVRAIRSRFPDVEVHEAPAERLPLASGRFDRTLAQLAVHFMDDAVGGLREMARVTRPDGVVAACVWDFAEGGRPLSLFWQVAGELDPDAPGEVARPGTRRGHLAELFGAAGCVGVEETTLTVVAEHPTFEDWWQPYTLGVGPAGSYVAGLGPAHREALAARCRDRLPDAPFSVEATAWAVRAAPTGTDESDGT